MNRIIKAVALIIIAVLAIIAGNASRTYGAFGGEEILALTLGTWAAYELVTAWQERKEHR